MKQEFYPNENSAEYFSQSDNIEYCAPLFIEILKLLPAYEAFKLMKGDKYLTGSDYSPEVLLKTIEELQPKRTMRGL